MGKAMLDGTTVQFISRRESQFRDFPPASAQAAIVIPFFGSLSIWVRAQADRGWQFPAGQRRSGETIGEAAKRQLWEMTRLSVPKLELLGCLARGEGRGRVAYVYACDVGRLPWWGEKPEHSVEIGAFVTTPKPVEGDWCLTLFDAARRARRGV